MAGANAGASNRWGVSPFMVGQTQGDGCGYGGGAGLQQAIDDCFAAGGGVVCIRPSTVPYVANLTLRDNVDLKAFHTDGRLPPGLDHVEIQGHHTWASASGAVVEVVISNIELSDPAFGDLITISPTGGTFCVLAIKYCGLNSDSGAGAGRAVVVNPDVTSAVVFASESCNMDAGSNAIECIGAGQQMIQVFNGSDVGSASAAAVEFTSGSCSLGASNSALSGSTFGLEDNTGSTNSTASFCTITGGTAAIGFTTPGGSFQSFHNTLASGGANYVSGTGTFFHVDTAAPGAKTLSGTVTETKINWQPYCSSGTTGTAYRGTAAFDSTQFNVSSDGFVQLSGGGGFVWVDQPLSTTVVSGQGNFITAGAVTLTLPVAPAQGDVCAFKDPSGNAPYIIQASGAQILVVANQVSGAGGTATSSQRGDALELTYYAAGNIWCANEITGNWLVV